MMMNNKAFRSLFACLIALLLTVTIIPFAAFAAEDTAPDESADVVLSAPADGAAEDADAEDISTEEKADDAADETADNDDSTTTGESEEESEEKKLGLSFWISLGVLGALIIVGIVFAIIKRAKLKIWWGSIKSELKKIVWSSPEQVKKNSIVVIVFVVALAVAIGLLDFVFFRGIGALSDLL